ncbi:unnamed protein product [Cercopithifilaria johnstoni]|uniref:SKI/SNO/DAC domain-containing protein n=1 Tax=Cercopithifilaria johnstoni TaxID=2874296 RepID=A0A8J2Q936_9BILA|nr:unnamed protein product [Cercopithifilaria johnstoni]
MISCNDIKSIESVNNARIYAYRGEKIAGFELQGIRMICLPQAYQTFLKNVISGLHIVHSKLKRLQTRLVICNVEQIRALRNLGAIQQGVNRCKLISCSDFDQLYDDCYKIHHRSGGSAKRSLERLNTQNDMSKKPKYTSDTIESSVSVEGTVVPFTTTTTQQIAVQHLMAATATAITASESLPSTEQTMDIIIPDHEFSASLSSIPLNLTKNANNHQYENDSNASQKRISSGNSKCIHQNDCSIQDASTEYMEASQVMLSKLISLIEIATLNLKTEHELIENEKSFICKLKKDFECKQNEYDKIKRELSMEQQKAKIYFQRYCKAKRESLKLKEKLIDLNDHINTTAKCE